MNIKPKIPKYSKYLGTKKQPPHILQLMHQKNTCNNQRKKQNKPIPMWTIIGCSPHPPTCVWVGWVFCYFRCLMSCSHHFHCRNCFLHHFRHSFGRHRHPPHPICLVVVPAIPILPSRCVQCCSHCLHGVE